MTPLLIVGSFTVAVLLLVRVARWHDRRHCRVCGARLSDARIGLRLRMCSGACYRRARGVVVPLQRRRAS